MAAMRSLVISERYLGWSLDIFTRRRELAPS